MQVNLSQNLTKAKEIKSFSPTFTELLLPAASAAKEQPGTTTNFAQDNQITIGKKVSPISRDEQMRPESADPLRTQNLDNELGPGLSVQDEEQIKFVES